MMKVTMDLANDPVVAAAIDAHGTEPQWAFEGGSWRLDMRAHGSAPKISIGDGCAVVGWWTQAGRLNYEAALPPCDAPIVRLANMDMAQSLLESLRGRRLNDLVTLDGDPGYVIKDIGTERLGEYRNLWAKVATTQREA